MYRFHVVSLKILSTGSFAPRNKSQEFSVVISVKFSICYVGAGTYEIQSDGIDVDISLKISTKEQGTPGAGGGPGTGGGPAPGGGPGAGGGPAPGRGPGAGGGPGTCGGPGTGGGSKPALCVVLIPQTRPPQGPGVATTSVPPTTGVGGGGATGPKGATQGATSPSGTPQVTTPQGATSSSGTPQVTTPATGTRPTTGVGAATTPPSGGGGGNILILLK